MKRSLARLSLAVLALAAFAGTLAAQTTPDQFLGFKLGADKKLADYAQITGYFQKLATETNKMKLVTIGESTQKRPILMAVISTPENLAKLDRWKEIARKLHDPRTTSPEEAKKLAKEGKAIVMITCSPPLDRDRRLPGLDGARLRPRHRERRSSTRTRSSATSSSFSSRRAIRTGTRWSSTGTRNTSGRQYEGGSMPWLYHPYAGHDNNRDYYMQNLVETRAESQVQYHEWLPQIHVDLHQQGSNGARLFIPPYMDPPLPNINPLVWRIVNLVGTNMGLDLTRQGMSGVVNGRSYTAWYIGASDDTPWLHNVAGILSEAASVRLATPIHMEPNEISNSFYEKMLDFVDPWPGGWWRLRDIVDYDLVLTKSAIKTAGLNREDILNTFYQMNKQAVEKVERNQPYRLRHPGQAARLSDHAQDARRPDDGRRRDPSGQGRFRRRRQALRRRLVRGQDGPALQALRLGPAREAEIPRHAAVPRRAPRSRPTTTPAGRSRPRWASPATR